MKARLLNFHFRRRWPDRDLCAEGSLEFNETSFIYALMGRSGAGKSSFARWLAGLTHAADEGRLEFGPDVWFDRARGISLRPQDRRVGYLSQSDFLFPHLDVRANIGYGLRRETLDQRQARVDEMLQLIGLGNRAGAKPRDLSGGERRRVALAQMLVTRPRLLILDEPFTGLDPRTKRTLLLETRRWISSFHLPTLMITHDPEEARAFTDDVFTYGEDDRLVIPPGSHEK